MICSWSSGTTSPLASGEAPGPTRPSGRKTHGLVEIGAECVAIDATLEPHLRATAPLTEYAWRYRYPGEPSEPEESEVRQALDRARAVVALVLGRVPAEAHP